MQKTKKSSLEEKDGMKSFWKFSVVLLVGLFVLLGAGKEKIQADSNTIMVDSYEIEEGDFSPGSTATVCFYLKNVGEKATAKNVIVNLSSQDNVTPIYKESNQKYVRSIVPGQKVAVRFEVDIPAIIEVEKARVELLISYELPNSVVNSSNKVSVFIPVQYDSSLVINSISVAKNVKLGAKALVSLSYSNATGKPMRDITVSFKGNIPKEQKSINIGNLEAGASQYKDIYVTFKKAGEQNLKISVSYKDSEGKSYVKEIVMETVNVIRESKPKPQTDDYVQKSDSGIKKVLKIVVLVAILAVGASILSIFLKKKD